MKKMRAIENIKVEETLYKSGEEFEIAEEETQRLIDLGAAEFVNSEIEKTETEEKNSSKKGKKNE